MKRSYVTQAYQNAETQSLSETDDPHQIILTMLEALIKSMNIFVLNINIREGGNQDLKSKHFARALTIIYSLQSSLDFEKGGDIANNLFQLYEFSRVKMIEGLSSGADVGTLEAIEVMSSIRDAWDEMGKQTSDEK